MLKYRINARQFLNSKNAIDITDSKLETLYGNAGNAYKLLICACKDLLNLQSGNKVISVVERNVLGQEASSVVNREFKFVKSHEVLGVNEAENVFTILTEKYFDLDLDIVARYEMGDEEDENKTEYVYFYFNESHYFDNPSLTNDCSDIVLHLSYSDNESYIKVVDLTMEYVNITTLRLAKDDFPEDLYLYRLLFGETNEPRPNADLGDTSNINVYRDSFFFGINTSFTFYYDSPVTTLQVPLSQKFETNLFQSEAIENDYVAIKKEKSINRVVDMEKDVYHPVIAKTKNGVELVSTEPVYKMKFNLHFREHRGDDWIAKEDGWWNGICINDEKKLDFMNESGNEVMGFYSLRKENAVPFKDNHSCQSDLLSYLNFTNSDVRYQKNKIKKSFLRLSFYDSMNPGKQNLLHYSTIFMNSGEYFTKYVRYMEDKPYSFITYDDNGKYEQTSQGFTGIKVNREPYETLIDDDFDVVEELRLSSQMVVQDKYNSNASSDGFYLYLWRDNDSGLMPTDIYMKVEFNHAGYGRSIPFMMPFWDPAKWSGKKGIKTFQEILDDWNEEENTDGQYGIRQYLKYSYIHFKYQYDGKNKRHVYYLDDNLYGNSVSFEDNTMVFNLYEAKLSNGNSVSSSNQTTVDSDVIVSYGNLVIELLSYNDVAAGGGSVTPSWRYSQTYVRQNGVTEEIIGGNTSRSLDGNGAQIIWSDTNGLINENTGNVSCTTANGTDNPIEIDKVTLTVKLNGKTASKSVSVKQLAATSNYVFTFDGNSMSDYYVMFDSAGGNKILNIISTRNGENVDFTLDKYSEGRWLTIEKENNTIELTAVENQVADNEKSSTITLTQEGSGNTLTVSVKLSSAGYEFSIEPVSIEFEKEGGVREDIVVTSRMGSEFADYEINQSTIPSWISVSKKTDDETKLFVECNANDGASAKACNIKLIQNGSNNEVSLAVTLKAAEYVFEVIPGELNFESAGGTKTISVTSKLGNTNVDYEITSLPSSWVTLSKTETGVKVTATKNEDTEAKQTTFVLTQSGSGKTKTITVNIDRCEDVYDFSFVDMSINDTTYEFSFTDGTKTNRISIPYEAVNHSIEIISRNSRGVKKPFTCVCDGDIVDVSSITITENISSEYDYIVSFNSKLNTSISEITDVMTFTQNDTNDVIILNIKQYGDNTVVIPDFDYLVTRYYWTDEDGRDLDTLTCLEGTGLKYSNVDVDGLTVGYEGSSSHMAETINDRTVVTYYVGDVNAPYLKHGGDNTSSGNESCLMDFNALCSEENLLAFKENNIEEIYVKIYTNWYGTKENGNCQIQFSAYKGGTMSRESSNMYNFINTGGTEIYNQSLTTNVFAYTSRLGYTDYQKYYTYSALLTYNISDRSAFLTLQDGKSGYAWYGAGRIDIAFTQDSESGVEENHDFLTNSSYVDYDGNFLEDTTSERNYSLCSDASQRKLEVTIDNYSYVSNVICTPHNCTINQNNELISVNGFNGDEVSIDISFIKNGAIYKFKVTASI